MGLTGVGPRRAAAVLPGFGETMRHGKSRCRARNAAPGTFDVFGRHVAKVGSAENSRVPRAGRVLGHHQGCKAANFGGEMQKGFIASWEHAALKVRALLKPF